jgi:hypothetical protein
MDFLHDLLTSRGSQIISRYVGMGLGIVAAKLHYAPADGEIASSSTFISACVVSGVLLIWDHYAHKVQKADDAK